MPSAWVAFCNDNVGFSLNIAFNIFFFSSLICGRRYSFVGMTYFQLLFFIQSPSVRARSWCHQVLHTNVSVNSFVSNTFCSLKFVPSTYESVRPWDSMLLSSPIASLISSFCEFFQALFFMSQFKTDSKSLNQSEKDRLAYSAMITTQHAIKC